MKEKWVERTEYNNVVSVKVVIPGRCNANCKFCYMKHQKPYLFNYAPPNYERNLDESLCRIVNEIGDKDRISIDITGNEPTCNWQYLRMALHVIEKYKNRVSRVTMTTNGAYLRGYEQSLKGVVDYVNISVHDFREKYRRKTMGITVYDNTYKYAVRDLAEAGIKCSAVAVIWKKYVDFPWWRDRFIEWCKQIGFVSLRFRCNVYRQDTAFFDEYMRQTMDDPRFQTITFEDTPDSRWCRLRMDDKFRVFFLHGVADTTKYTKGIEFVIHDDGLAYCDYEKKQPISDYPLEIGKIYDRVVEV